MSLLHTIGFEEMQRSRPLGEAAFDGQQYLEGHFEEDE